MTVVPTIALALILEYGAENYMKYKLYVDCPDGRQDIVEVEASGEYYDNSKVLWDERIDGELPPVAVGAMTRIGDTLTIDDNKLVANSDKQLSNLKSTSLRKIDAANDDVITAVIGRRDTEYLMAEKQAQAYVDAKYKGDTFPYVDSWAQAKGADAKWAADDIIATSLKWRSMQSDMRAKRLKAKEDVRNADSVDTIGEIIKQWYDYVDIIKKQLGV